MKDNESSHGAGIKQMKNLSISLFVSCVLFLAAPSFAQNTITFNADMTTAISQVSPVLTWDTIPQADSCVASGSWSGDKGGSGTETLPVITSSATYTLTCEWVNGAATLSWTPPTQNEDGSALVDLAGYEIYYGTASGDYPNVIEILNPSVTTYVVENLSAGEWFFSATAINESGVESAFSNETSKIVAGIESLSETVSITINARPNPPSDFLAE